MIHILHLRLFFEEEFLLAVPVNHTWSKLKSIKTSDLANQSLLLLNDGHCLREQALSFCFQTQAVEMENFRATSFRNLTGIWLPLESALL